MPSSAWLFEARAWRALSAQSELSEHSSACKSKLDSSAKDNVSRAAITFPMNFQDGAHIPPIESREGN
eukprot:CAMPEP_0197637732 /NCGR_PEP_ID=MMETSP1338-20131121/12866_1 /TAXON_ID=43686 ORGANISM="Pelagodinium beii, Strain RCC1491" /NCGR_SAMPLE_ID=MMETSP1338 /ASSEMBLY_ACC=CAM_ASM_000754 /LENGTH=67 /DNA_ID=CAMNT_0043210189 /DNA_START=20 /DNA_END=220 /DNA_ORIENTATION=-